MADEATTQTGASEGDQATAGAVTPGASGDGGSSVTDSASTDAQAILAAERAKAEQVQRELQAAKDREADRSRKLEAELAKLRGNTDGDAAKPLTRDELFAALDERERVGKLRQAADTLRSSEDFKYADKALFDRADTFDSVEAFKAALVSSHDSAKSVIDAAVQSELQAKLAEAGKRYGIDLAPQQAPAPTSGDPTLEQLNSTPMSEWDAKGWDDETVDRVIRNANQT